MPGRVITELEGETGPSSDRDFITLRVSDVDSLWDRGVTGQYVNNIFTRRDVESSRALIDQTLNPYRIAQFLALDMALVCKGLEDCQRETTLECHKLEKELEQAQDESNRALERAREEVAVEVAELRHQLDEAESSKVKAEAEAKELTKDSHKLKKKLKKAKAEARTARTEAESSRSELEKKIAELAEELEKSKADLQESRTQAVSEYKDSDDFRLELATAAAKAFNLGQRHYREVLVETHPDMDLSKLDELLLGSLPEEAEEDDGEDEDGAPGNGEATAQGVVPGDESSHLEAEVPGPDVQLEGAADLTPPAN